VLLSRPDQLNAINMPMYADLVQAFAAVEEDPETWVVILRGAGRAFSVGADLKERQTMTEADVRRRRRLAPSTFGAIAGCTRPVVAAIHGYAFGGGWELALAADLNIAAESTQFSLPEAALGVIPGGGATQRVPRLAGPQFAKELIFTGRRISATVAKDHRLLTKVVPDDQIVAAAQELAEEIASAAPIAVRQVKRAVDASANMDVRSGVLYEEDLYQVCIKTEDRLEGLSAFRERRPPVFQGR
jgi:enoyl-CoA hydratase/carnithine racemase